MSAKSNMQKIVSNRRGVRNIKTIQLQFEKWKDFCDERRTVF